MIAEGMLLVRGGPDNGSTVALSQGMTVIGRVAPSDIILDEVVVSRRHAGIRGGSDGYWIADLGSRNGTFVNGERVEEEPRRLRDLDRIELGGTDIPVHWIFRESQATTGVPKPTPKS